MSYSRSLVGQRQALDGLAQTGVSRELWRPSRLPSNLTPERLASRREVLKLIDEQSELLEFSARARGIDAHYQRARPGKLELLSKWQG